MAKGKNGCDAGLQPVAGEVELLDLRDSWTDYFEQRLSSLLADSELLDRDSGRALLSGAVKAYLRGDGGPEAWMADHENAFRLALAGLLHQEEHPKGAVLMLNTNLFPRADKQNFFSQLLDQDLDHYSRSLYRHALAEAAYSDWDFDEARSYLEDDVEDPQVLDARRSLAKSKLSALASLEAPAEWYERLIPDDFRGGLHADRFASLSQFSLSDPRGWKSGRHFVGVLSNQGLYREALELSDMMVEANKDHQARLWFALDGKADSLKRAGHLDQAADLYMRTAEMYGGSGPSADASYIGLRESYAEAGDYMAPEVREAAQLRRDKAEPGYFAEAQRAYLNTLVEQGKLEKAMQEVDDFAEQHKHPLINLPEDPLELKIETLSSAIYKTPDRDFRSQLRQQLVVEFIARDLLQSAEDVLQAELSDSGISFENKSWADVQNQQIALRRSA